ncbi:proteasome subunit alpha type-6 [Anaeramoeba ignava]|uniref:Proteasome subunit alpha type-6 n=1 Tax=Anaeramoeba ignava TaxID=1746090 RepID=A0A9Q0LJF9_ANAIG|nr:proteasome subunit alpha type-6 [Anaeramoeba ignava]|eukprot:Anaeramoba_ignava/a613299_127.p1 GENE.a613299_127~~a613299_127.p1  ORF type:complete len:258 (-),score=88.99 a613299_127:66-803(-)
MTSSAFGFDRHISVFSPEGRLYQIEYVYTAIRAAGNTTIGVRGEETVCVVTQKKVPDKLTDPTTVTSMFTITNNIGCAMTGIRADMKTAVQRLRYFAHRFEYENGFEIPVSHLARKMADFFQLFTQHAFMRPLGLAITLIGIDEEVGPQLYKIEPSGYFLGYKATCVGQKEQEGTNFLEKKIKKETKLNKDETIQLAISSLQSVLGVDFRPSDIEVGIVEKDSPKFTLLSEELIDSHLTAISERD